MKKIAFTLIFLLTVQFSFSYWYYQPYPITAQVTQVGGQWRVDCSVYDSLLSTVVLYNGPLCNTLLVLDQPSLNTGMIIYNSDDNANNPDNYMGAIVYDMELHQFKPKTYSCLGCYDYYFSAGANNGVATFTRTASSGLPDLITNAAYYDIKTSLWVTTTTGNMYDGQFSVGSANIFSVSEYDPDGDYESYFLNPKKHQWVNLLTGWTPGAIPFPTSSFDFVKQTGNAQPFYGEFGYVGHDFGGITGFSDANSFGSGYGIVYWDDNSSGNFEIRTFDVQSESIVPISLSGYNSTSFQQDGHMFCITDITGTIVYYGVYSINQHAWMTGSDTLINPVSSVSLSNQTVLITTSPGNIITRGYDDTIGWGNFSTPTQLLFYLGNYTSPTEGNLILVKDYSINSSNTYFDFGDGITTTLKSAFHLYKLNGHYRLSSAANFNVCLKQSNSSLSNCQTISFPTGIETFPITLSQSVNINQMSASAFEVVNNSGKLVRIKIFNSLGQEIIEPLICADNCLVDLKNSSKGIYIIEVIDSSLNSVLRKKVVKG